MPLLFFWPDCCGCAFSANSAEKKRWMWVSICSSEDLSVLHHGVWYELWDCSSMAFIVLREFPSVPSLLRVFIVKRCSILSNDFAASIEMIIWFSPLFIYMVYYIDLFLLDNPCIPGINFALSWCIILFMLLESICYFIGDFTSVLMRDINLSFSCGVFGLRLNEEAFLTLSFWKSLKRVGRIY